MPTTIPKPPEPIHNQPVHGGFPTPQNLTPGGFVPGGFATTNKRLRVNLSADISQLKQGLELSSWRLLGLRLAPFIEGALAAAGDHADPDLIQLQHDLAQLTAPPIVLPPIDGDPVDSMLLLKRTPPPAP